MKRGFSHQFVARKGTPRISSNLHLPSRGFEPAPEVQTTTPEINGSQEERERADRLGHHFSTVSLLSDAAPIQPKLTLGSGDAAHVHAADLMAEQAVNHNPFALDPTTGPSIQRAMGGTDVNAPADLEQSIDQARGTGQPLVNALRGSMESAFGTGFGGVRIHTDTRSDQMNRSIQAKVFTTGQDIFFRQGAYDPGSRSGQELIAHELTHVVQQGGGAQSTIQRFESNEHKAMGDQGTTNAAGKPEEVKLLDKDGNVSLTLTFGDITAMSGDYFGSVAEIEQLAKDPGDNGQKAGSADEIKYVLAVKVHGEEHREDQFSDAVKNAVAKRYYTLAGNNQTHFTNPGEKDDQRSHNEKAEDRDQHGNTINNAGSYRENHLNAIREAIKAGKAGGGKDRALLYEGFASHFLTDAYASGHIRTPRAGISEYWNKKVPMFWLNLKLWMAETIAQHINDNNWRGVATVQLIWEQARSTFDEILHTKGIPDLTFGDVISGAVHDMDNEAGVQADIGGQKVKLVGDGQVLDEKDRLLANGVETLQKVVAGVQVSRQDIEDAFALGQQGKSEADAIASLRLPDGLFRAEQLWPQALPDQDPGQTNPSLNWKTKTVDELFSDPRMAEALSHFAREKADTLEAEISFDEAYKSEAMKKGVLSKFRAGGNDVVKTFKEIINYTPGTVAELGGVGGHDSDDNALEYYEEALKRPGGLASLSFSQKKKLIVSVLEGATIGKEELMIVDLLGANAGESTRLIQDIGWQRLWDDLDGNDCLSFVQTFGPDYWKSQSYEAKRDQVERCADGRTSTLEEETIMVVLRTCSKAEVQHITDEVGDLTWDLTDHRDSEYRRMIGE